MADLKTAAAKFETEMAADDLASQIALLRSDLAQLSETVASLGQGAKNVVIEEASQMTEKVRDKVRDEPIFVLVATAGVAYLFGLLSRR